MHVIHVLPKCRHWRVACDRSLASIDVLSTKERALEHARSVAGTYERALVVVHRTDGSIESVLPFAAGETHISEIDRDVFRASRLSFE